RLHGRWATHWLLGYRGVTNATNERTLVPALIPLAGVGHNFPLVRCRPELIPVLPCLLANLSSFSLDYVARQNLGAAFISYFILSQFPVLPPTAYTQPVRWSPPQSTVNRWISQRVVELTYTAWDLEPFAHDCGWACPPFRWDDERRFLLRCELDAAF